MRSLVALAIAGGLLFADGPARATPTAGINMGAPVWEGVAQDEALEAAIATGAAHVRVNFRLDVWSAPGDATRHGGKTFFEVYDRVVDAIVSRGLEVYGLLNDELVAPGLDLEGPAFEDAYVANALAVIERYRDRVRVWETINEPNDFAGGSSARMTPDAFARVHGRLYREAKIAHANDPCWDVTILTGPLFSFDGKSDASWLDAAIASGRAGGAWKEVLDATGSDPIDGVGYHVYVAQGPDSSEADVGASAGANLDAVRAVLDRRGLSDRKTWISEIGYQASLLTEAGQATRLDTAFAALGARPDVASIQWFTIADFSGEEWGLLRPTGFASADARPAHARFVANARLYAPPRAARLEVELVGARVAGATVIARVTATNLGTQPWPGAGGVRLGAAHRCPAAWATNEIAWAPAPSDGYATSIVDARRLLPAGASIAQGGSVILEVPVVVPDVVGTKARFAARMVDEGVAWFGSTVFVDLESVGAETSTADPSAPSSDDAGRSHGRGAPRASDGCGCREARSGRASGGEGGVVFGGVLALVGLALRRRASASRLPRRLQRGGASRAARRSAL
ncbi:MAG: hypothetical protein KF795_03025 [Labilithrix sp.]|nr:hypothetical protein [Labilithrix sp.]